MQTKTLIAHPLPYPCLLPNPNRSTSLSLSPFSFTPPLPNLRSSAPIRPRNTLFTACLLENLDCDPGGDGDGNDAALVKADELENRSIWDQMKEIAMFTGPATGLWLCGPLMSLIDTVVIGQGSTIELAALGPGTVMCDYMSYVFMFLSIATSNMVATSLARQSKNL